MGRTRRRVATLSSAPLYTDQDRERVVPVAYPSDASESYRTAWRRDYARLLHSPAFRRLQGKTQLYPSSESDFFRNRLTHSLEVAQIAKSIAIRNNNTEPYFKSYPIDTDLVETAALAHDLGHPPFGHNGEEALNECMRGAGGFEGNAQTLRILSKLEKRDTVRESEDPDLKHSVLEGEDNRAGLNLTYRTLASIVKYDNPIPHHIEESQSQALNVVKGYYFTEAPLVAKIKKQLGVDPKEKLKTVECAIMDIADDIAYSTYDLEDSFKAGFLTPLTMWTAEDDLIRKVAIKVKERLDKFYPDYPPTERNFSDTDVLNNLMATLDSVFELDQEKFELYVDQSNSPAWSAALITREVVQASDKIRSIGYYRTKFTSDIVGELIRGITVQMAAKPFLSSVRIEIGLFKKMEVLKNFAFEGLIMSPRLKVTEHRGKDIVKSIFEALRRDGGHMLMPEDFQYTYTNLKDSEERERVICDFIAGMTDHYAVNFYGRLFGTNPESVFSPL